MKYLIILLAIVVTFSCREKKEALTAQDIINKTIENAGGDKYKRAKIVFNFRDHTYKSTRKGGEFQLERLKTDSTGNYRDVINNTGFQRFLNDTLVTVPDTMVVRYSSSINSVHYFAHLPYGLNDRAVNKKLVGETTLKGEPYYKIEITFQQEGGGADHHDEFMYWIHKENFTVDYLAYKFLVNDGGIRFRAAFNPRVIEGIRFVDYMNYTITNFNTKLEDLDKMYEEGKLEMLSTIETEVVSVEVRD